MLIGSSAEGAFYVWMKQEFDDILGEEAEIAATFWNVKQDGNVNPAHDAHDELKGKVCPLARTLHKSI